MTLATGAEIVAALSSLGKATSLLTGVLILEGARSGLFPGAIVYASGNLSRYVSAPRLALRSVAIFVTVFLEQLSLG